MFIVDCIKTLKRTSLRHRQRSRARFIRITTSADEFPDLQVEERSAVSIARRLQDPLSELVKIDPGSVGVGQYQHDVAKKRLAESLSFVVETAVNRVGVNVNTASASLLQYVAGLSKTVAENIVKARDENGLYMKRNELKKVPRLGAKPMSKQSGFYVFLNQQILSMQQAFTRKL